MKTNYAVNKDYSESYDEVEIMEWLEELLDDEGVTGKRFDQIVKNFKKAINQLEDGETIKILGNVIEVCKEESYDDIYDYEEEYDYEEIYW